MKLSNAIGGYFGLETRNGVSYHKDGISLDSGRNCLKYILELRKYNHIYIPYYTCDAVMEPLKQLDIAYEFYSIDDHFELIKTPEINDGNALLYINYFGLKSDYVKKLSGIVSNLIVDAVQAFFFKPIRGIDTFYSPRKFFGVPDGGYVYSEKKLSGNLPEDFSITRFSHLLQRIDESAEQGYENFLNNERSFSGKPIRKMSKLTKVLMDSIDYDFCQNKRNENFRYLHEHLKDKNEIKWIDQVDLNGPMVYPFLSKKNGLREKLIKNRIYVAAYWPNLSDLINKNSFEAELYENLLPLPIDQRYGREEMDFIVEKILEK
ncbi:MAG TPA: hypothetical protein VFI29_20725 [Hanamia sp.]|nr:hypothetical protein [Hanamia sp.]